MFLAIFRLDILIFKNGLNTKNIFFFQVRQVMVGSKLAMPILGQIWDLSDVDRDGFLDRYEFTVAMHLVFRALQGDKLPETLPEELSPEKVPKSLSAMPNLNGAQRVRTKIFFTFFSSNQCCGTNF